MAEEIKDQVTEEQVKTPEEKPAEKPVEKKDDDTIAQLYAKISDFEKKEAERLKAEKEQEEKSLLEQKKFAELADKYKAEKEAIAKERETYLEKLKAYEQKEEENRLAVYAKIKDAKIAEESELAMLEKQPIEILELFLKKAQAGTKKDSPDAKMSNPQAGENKAPEYMTSREKRLMQLMQGSSTP